MTAQELRDLLNLVAAKADSDKETRDYWNNIFWELVTYKTEEEK